MADIKYYATVPLNADGSINVRLKQDKNETLDVNIETTLPNAFIYAEPIQVKIKE